MHAAFEESPFEPVWRRPAPRAQQVAAALYSWKDPGWVFLFAMLAAMPFLFAAALSPALLSLAPTAEMIAPIADARAVFDGAAKFKNLDAPFYAMLLLVADVFVDAPGRIHLVAKAIAAALLAYPLAYLGAARFPAALAVLLTAMVAGYVAAPFSGPPEIGLAFFLLAGMALVCAPADERPGRARFEGALAGLSLAALWLTSPVFSLAAFAALAAAPFVAGRPGVARYVAAMIAFTLIVAALEPAAPGLFVARASAASDIFAGGSALAGESALGLAGVASAAFMAIAIAAIFGGAEAWRGWGAGLGFVAVAFVAARLAEANAAPAFVVAASFAALSVASPFYDGVFRAHDRASIAAATAAAGLTLFWAASLIAHAGGQFLMQARVAREAPADIRAQLGLVQPGGPTIARWIEEGRFSTPEARELFALAPIDQSAMLLEAADRARRISRYGVDVAILTGADAACVIAEKRACDADGAAAAGGATVVFAPRLDLDPATKAAKRNAEVLLYTEFRLVEEGAFWDVWVRRGAKLPAGVVPSV